MDIPLGGDGLKKQYCSPHYFRLILLHDDLLDSLQNFRSITPYRGGMKADSA